ncbi:thyroid hormone-inducible hepatic protein-like [Varanus komodoensis]|uniref:thyroid hormone-inducible hepatic protein-like n=1 Tax=Varanus komodoensis TaxID=61221 RepID=UPI001CF7ADFB|nr:thyroid hormone-inducible hepatic protein-like [Varanus komodoensis]
MEGYFSAVHKMEQTVMFPSLLRGVAFEEQDATFEADSDSDKDLFEYFTQLKAIKQVVEQGLRPLNSPLPGSLTRVKEDAEGEADLERLFYYHISGLQRVFHQLTGRANSVTSKYNEILQEINQNTIAIHW